MCLALMLFGATSGGRPAAAEPTSTGGFAVSVPGEVALGSLTTLTDGYLKKFADDFSLVALTDQARKARWELIREPLAAVAERNVDALVWFALPDGSYWSVQEGQSSENLSDRPYFPHVLAGETVMGALVVSKATGRSSAIVAVPIWGPHHDVVGVLGASIYLDQLSSRLNAEMAIGETLIFYSFDSTPLLALEQDPSLTFVDPLSLGPDIRAVFEYMLARDEGTVQYRWASRWRTVLFRRSPVTGWWYAFGVVK
jgi:methyl-accepting chemotaxis protein